MSRPSAEFIRHYLWKYRKHVGVGLVALLVVDLLEVIPPIFLKNAVDLIVDRRPLALLAWTAGGYFGVSLLQGVCRYLWRVFLIRASLMSGRDLRSRYAHHLFSMPSSFFDRKRVGDLMSLATSDVEAVRMAIGTGVLVLADSIFYFVSVPLVMFWLSPKLALLAFVPLPIIPWIVLRNEKEIHRRFEKVQEAFSEISAMVQESLNGIRVVKAFAREDSQLDRFRKAGEKYVRLSLRLSRVQSAFGPTLDLTMSLGLVLLLFVAGGDLVTDPTSAVTLGTFVAFQRYIQKMVWPMAALGMAIGYYQRALTSSGRIQGLFAISSDVRDGERPVLPRDFVQGGRTAGRIEFRDLRFSFPGSQRQVLSGITLTIEPGERVAFVGAIGAGKSALLSLLPRLYPVERGMLFVDGVDINDWPLQELRRQVGFVSQDVFLFSESVLENVAYGLHEWIERGQEPVLIEEAARLAAVHDDVTGLTASYRTRLGERGVNLSGGQKQRLTIARALAKSPSILVLDDALSSVDVQTEERILSGLRERPKRNTELIAAHRISTIRDADRIVVLDSGKIRQIGTHQLLLEDRRGNYRAFYEQQRLREELEAIL